MGGCLVVEVKQFYAGPVIDVRVNNLLEAVCGDVVVGHRVSGVMDLLILVQLCLHRVLCRLLRPAQHAVQVVKVPALGAGLWVRPRADLLRLGCHLALILSKRVPDKGLEAKLPGRRFRGSPLMLLNTNTVMCYALIVP